MVQTLQPSFAAGELSTEVQGRVDVAKYQVGLKTSENGLIKVQGGWMNRAGFLHISARKYPPSHVNGKARLIPFSYNTEQTYSLIFGHEYMWVIKDGGIVLDTAVTDSINGIDITTDTMTANAHPFANGNWVFIAGIVGTEELNGRFFKVSDVATNSLKLRDQHDNIIDMSGFSSWVSGGTIYKVYEISTPYAASDLSTIRWAQSANELSITHKSYDPYVLTRADHDDWTLAAINFSPTLAAPTGVNAVDTVSAGVNQLDIFYVVTSESDETGEISYASTPDSCVNNLSTAGNYNTITWSAATGADRYNVYRRRNGIYGWIGTTTGLSFIDDNLEADTTETPPEPSLPFDGANNKPRCVMYHDQRRVFGGKIKKPNGIDGSQINRFSIFSVSRPAMPSDAYSFGLVAKEVQEVRDLLSMRDLIAFTSGGLWKITGADGGSIEPSSINAEQQTENGISELVPPLMIGNRAMYWSDFGTVLSDIGYDFGPDGYTGDDLTVLCRHLFKYNYVVESAWHKEPYSCAWHLRDDGVLLSQTYHKQHDVNAFSRHTTDGKFKSVCTIREGQETALYVLVDREIDGVITGTIERMASRIFRNVDDCNFLDCSRVRNNWNTNQSYLVTLTGGLAISDDDPNWTTDSPITITATGHAPFLASDVGREIVLKITNDDGVITERCRFLVTSYGSATILTLEALQAVPVSMQNTALYNWGFASDVVDNLWHLEGKTVYALADGDIEGDAGELIVSNGSITLQTPAVNVVCGLPYTAMMVSLRMNGVTQQDGVFVSKEKSIPYVDILVEETRHIKVAANINPDPDTGEIKTSTAFMRGADGEEWGEPTDLLDNEFIRVTMPADWSQGQVAIIQDLPLPITVLAIAPEVVIGD